MPTFIPFASDDEVLEIGHGLIDRTLPKSAWTHAAHFASALWLLSNRPRIEVAEQMPGLIRAYNEATGVANTDTSGYHATITEASLRAADDFLFRSRRSPRNPRSPGRPGRPLFEICNALMKSPLGKSDWLLAYWTRPRLFSVEARRAWLDPDIKALPY
jgi:hypothetical protein